MSNANGSVGRQSAEPRGSPTPNDTNGNNNAGANGDQRGSRTKYTITACARCRQRKSRCDAGLPRCHQCERTGNHCEYYDQTKSRYMPRTYIVDLQNRVKMLQKELSDLENNQSHEPDPEALVREAAVVRFKDTDETKYLGPASGTTMTRILLQLVKKVTKKDNIKEIISEERASNVRSQHENEENKPTSKDVDYLYPLTSQSAAPELVPRELGQVLLRVYNIKVQTMYPVFHEPTLAETFAHVYAGSTDPYKNFVVRMVMAIALQRGQMRYAGLADSFYLAAMSHFEAIVRLKDLKTLQCFVLIGQYSLLTPTRTAVFYVIGLAVRLAQALGICEERTIQTDADGTPATEFEIDMRRRLFWAVMTMDYGLAHSLGRPAMMATSQEHVDVIYFKPIDDQYIRHEGILPGPASRRKWIAIHFYKMRMLQLEIRRTLYQRKRPHPQNEDDPWFQQMQKKLLAWRDASPNDTEGEESGFNKIWFHGRYHTMIVFLCRPSPQIPRPTAKSAMRCYEACEFNIEMQREQVQTKSVETTWAFTQSLFMAVNTILWTLSYSEVRAMRTREEVNNHLQVALEAMRIAAVRWPGVNSAVEIYEILIEKTLAIFDTEGDVPINAGSPFDFDRASAGSGVDPSARSRTASPLMPNVSFSPPPPSHERIPHTNGDYHGNNLDVRSEGNRSRASSGTGMTAPSPHWTPNCVHAPTMSRLSHPSFHPLPTSYADMSNWQFKSAMLHPSSQSNEYYSMIGPLMNEMGPRPDVMHGDQGFTGEWLNINGGFRNGLSTQQQGELLQELGDNGMQDFEHMIQESHSAIFADSPMI